MTVAACPTTAELTELFQGTPSDADAARLEQHVQSCSVCLAKLKDLLKSKDTVSGAFAGLDTLGDASQPSVQMLMKKLEALRPAPASSGETAAFSTASVSSPISGTDGDVEAEPDEELTTTQISQYRLVRMLGVGGMGMVYEAFDEHLERPVALKVMKPSLAKNASARKRFLQEARSAAKIQHDHIVPIFQVGEDQSIPFLAMQLLEGTSLADLLKRQGALKPKQVIRLGMQMAEGLAAAHERGLIHRDIKPGNIWIEPVKGGRVKILDFGLARLEQGGANLTQSGMIVGTPAYMAPEQARGEKNVDGRADLFSLGCVLYLMSTGTMAFAGNDPVGVLMAVQMKEPTPPRAVNPEVPHGLADLIMKLLAKDPAERPASAREVVKELKAMEKGLADSSPGATGETAAAIHAVAPPSSATVAVAPANPFANLSECVARPESSQRMPPVARRRRVLVGVAAAILAIVAAAVFYIVTDNGTIEITTEDKTIKVIVEEAGGKVAILDPQSKQVWVLNSGKYTIKLDGNPDGLEIDLPKDRAFEMRRGGKQVVAIRKVQGPIAVGKGPEVKETKIVALAPGNYALELGGGTDHVSFDGLVMPEGLFTWEAWVSPKDKSNMALMTLPTDDKLGLYRLALKNNGPNAVTVKGKKNAIGMTAGNSLPESRPFHLAASFDYKKWTLWVNGRKVGENAHHYDWVYQVKSLFPAKLGIDSGFAIHPEHKHDAFQGRIDEIRISKVRRYEQEFTPATRFETDKDTVALYHCDEGQGDVLKDSSGNGHHGKIVGAKWVKVDATDVPPAKLLLAFDGNTKVEVPSLKLPRIAPLTVEGYVTVTSETEATRADLFGVPIQFLLNVPKAGHPRLTAHAEAKKALQVTRPKLQTPFVKNRKTHVAGVWNGNAMTLFIDGKKVDSKGLGAEQLNEPLRNFVIGESVIGRFEEVRVSKIARYDQDFTPTPRFVPDPDTLALYRFDEGQGGVLKDHSGNNHHGTITGWAEWVKADGSPMPPAAPRYALDFSAPEARVEIPPVLRPDQPFAVEMVVMPRGNGQADLFKAWKGPTRFWLWKTSHNVWRWGINNTVADFQAPAHPGQRTHLVGVSTGKVLRLFVDGRLVKTTPIEGALAEKSVNEMFLGAKGGAQPAFEGTINAFRFSSTARDNSDFAATDRFEADKDTLILYHFDEGQGDVLTDSSGNGHHGKIVGAKWVKAIDPDRRVAELVLKRGGEVNVVTDVKNTLHGLKALGQLPAEPFKVHTIFLFNPTNGKVGNEDLQQFGSLSALKELQLWTASEITDAGIEEFTRSPAAAGVEWVMISGSPITDAGAAHFRRCPKLRKLQLKYAQVTDKFLDAIQDLGSLEDLSFGSPHLTDAAFDKIGRFANLRSLEFAASVNDAGLAKIAGLKLVSLVIYSQSLTTAGMHHLKDMKTLTHIGLYAGDANLDAGLKALVGHPELNSLSLDGSKITDAGLQHLKEISKLAFLHVRGCKVTGEGVKMLSAALPGCKIVWDGGTIEPKTPADPERQAAEWVLSMGGKVGINDLERYRQFTSAKDLPAEPLQVTSVFLQNDRITSADLERLKPLTHLLGLTLRSLPGVNDAGLEHLRAMTKRRHSVARDRDGAAAGRDLRGRRIDAGAGRRGRLIHLGKSRPFC